MTTDNNNDGLEIPAHLKREPKAKPAAKADALNIAGATPGASQALADEVDANAHLERLGPERELEFSVDEQLAVFAIPHVTSRG